MNPKNMETTHPEDVHEKQAELDAAQEPVAKEPSRSRSIDDQLAFLNSLPVINKPTPKPKPVHNVFDEHLAFLSSLPRIDNQEEPPKPAPVVKEEQRRKPAKQKPKKKTVRQVQRKKSPAQLQREEKNRIEKEKAEAKKAEIRKRQQEAGLEKGPSLRAKPKDEPKKKSLFGRFLKA